MTMEKGPEQSGPFFCPLPPCLPPDRAAGAITLTVVRMSRSFETAAAYIRHVEREHFIARDAVPRPFTTERK